jgi:hypothetical protein
MNYFKFLLEGPVNFFFRAFLIRKFSLHTILALIFLVLASPFFSLKPEDAPRKSDTKAGVKSNDSKVFRLPFLDPSKSWSVSLYGGPYTETDLLPILFRGKTEYRGSDIYVMGFSHPLSYKFQFLDFELEGNLAKHNGLMNHWEVNVFYIARWNYLFGLPTSIAIGEGLSLASENPRLENVRKGLRLDNATIQFDSIESRNVLNYLMVEWELGDPATRYPRFFMRIHHRSGVFGFYCKPDPACGSNFVTYGVRIPFSAFTN